LTALGSFTTAASTTVAAAHALPSIVSSWLLAFATISASLITSSVSAARGGRQAGM
jgi:hypothetical protein